LTKDGEKHIIGLKKDTEKPYQLIFLILGSEIIIQKKGCGKDGSRP
jgi:hypothetical protein